MSESLSATVSALRQSSERLAEVSSRLAGSDPGASAFGMAGPGRLGELGQAFYLLWQRALDAQERRAATLGADIDDVADGVARASAGYSDIDETARRRSPEVL